MDSSEVINKLEHAGWIHVRTKGDHWDFRKDGFQRPTCVPHPNKDLPTGTVKAIERQTGVKLFK